MINNYSLSSTINRLIQKIVLKLIHKKLVAEEYYLSNGFVLPKKKPIILSFGRNKS